MLTEYRLIEYKPSIAMQNAIVDRAWFDHFRPADVLGVVDEVNFWRPLAQQRFRAWPIGGPLFFRLKHPYSAIAGFGFFAGEYALSINMAWEIFGPDNDDPSYKRFVSRIEEYRRRLGAHEQAGASPVSCLVRPWPERFSTVSVCPRGHPRLLPLAETFIPDSLNSDGEPAAFAEVCRHAAMV